jgi:hypothetical protein
LQDPGGDPGSGNVPSPHNEEALFSHNPSRKLPGVFDL